MKKINKLICKYFGHKWIYGFIPSSINHEKTNVRTCKCCNEIQYWKKESILFRDESEFWSTLVTYTDFGAKEKLGIKYQN